MTWFKVDDSLPDSPAVMALSEHKCCAAALGLWVICGAWCAKHLTNGFVPARVVTRFGGKKTHAAALVSVGMWELAEGGYQFHNWLKYQPSKADIQDKREAARMRMRRNRSREHPSEHSPPVRANALDTVPDSRPVPSRPVPTSESDAGARALGARADSAAPTSAQRQEFAEAYRALCHERKWARQTLSPRQIGDAIARAADVAEAHGCSLFVACQRLMARAHELAPEHGGDVYLAVRKCDVPEPAPVMADPYASLEVVRG